jgi:hypothetical protein
VFECLWSLRADLELEGAQVVHLELGVAQKTCLELKSVLEVHWKHWRAELVLWSCTRAESSIGGAQGLNWSI